MINLASGAQISGEEAEYLVNATALEGRDWRSAMNEVDKDHAANLFDDCKMQLDTRFKAFVESQAREDRDRISLMVGTLQRHLDRQSRDRIAKYHTVGTDKQRRLIPAEEGKLKKLVARLQGRMDELRLREKMESRSNFVSGGLIRIV